MQDYDPISNLKINEEDKTATAQVSDEDGKKYRLDMTYEWTKKGVRLVKVSMAADSREDIPEDFPNLDVDTIEEQIEGLCSKVETTVH
jgi:hypothetical protein